jgi:hypothetical protein
VVGLGVELHHQRPHAARGALLQFEWLSKTRGARAFGAWPRRLCEQSLQGLQCLRDPPGTGFLMIWCLLRTVGVALLYLSVAGKRLGGAAVQSLPNYCRLKRQNAVLLAAVRNGVVVAKHAFYRFHRAFRTSFDVPELHYLLF